MKIKPLTGINPAKIVKNKKKLNNSVSKVTDSGKNVTLDYEKGLLKYASVYDGVQINTKEYFYNKQNQLIKVLKNGKSIFEKVIKHNIGVNYTRTELINNEVARTFDEQNRIIDYRIAPKLLFGTVHYNGKNRIDTRYFLSEGSYEGNGVIKIKNSNTDDPIATNGIIDKKIIKDLDTGIHIVLDGNEKTFKTTINSKNFSTTNEIYTNNKGQPLWLRLLDSDGESFFDQKIFYTSDGKKSKELYSQSGGKWFIENLFDERENIIQERKLNPKGETIQTIKSKFNENNKCTEQKTYNKENKLVDENRFIYDKNGILRVEVNETFDKYGSTITYDVYDKKGYLKKTGEIFGPYKVETHYDENGLERKYIKKNKNRILILKEYVNEGEERIKTVVRNKNKRIKYIIEHSRSKRGETMTNTNVFKTPKGKILGYEKLKHNNETGKSDFTYFDKNNKKISYEELCSIVKDTI